MCKKLLNYKLIYTGCRTSKFVPTLLQAWYMYCFICIHDTGHGIGVLFSVYMLQGMLYVLFYLYTRYRAWHCSFLCIQMTGHDSIIPFSVYMLQGMLHVSFSLCTRYNAWHCYSFLCIQVTGHVICIISSEYTMQGMTFFSVYRLHRADRAVSRRHRASDRSGVYVP